MVLPKLYALLPKLINVRHKPCQKLCWRVYAVREHRRVAKFIYQNKENIRLRARNGCRAAICLGDGIIAGQHAAAGNGGCGFKEISALHVEAS